MDMCEACKSTIRCEEEKKQMIARLKRIEGQVRGIAKMVDDNRYCIDIINQVNAIDASLSSFSRSLLQRHINTCVMDDVKDGKTDKLDELGNLLRHIMR